MDAFDRFSAAKEALLEPRECPDCGADLDQEANCIGGRLLCPDCWDVAFRKTYRPEAVPVKVAS